MEKQSPHSIDELGRRDLLNKWDMLKGDMSARTSRISVDISELMQQGKVQHPDKPTYSE